MPKFRRFGRSAPRKVERDKVPRKVCFYAAARPFAYHRHPRFRVSDPNTISKSARESLSKGLNALQADPTVPQNLVELAAPIAQAMGALHQLEKNNALSPHADVALNHLRGALAQLQGAPPNHPAVNQALDAVAQSLTLVHSLSRMAQGAPPIQPVKPAAPPAPAAAAPAPAPAPPAPKPIAAPVALKPAGNASFGPTVGMAQPMAPPVPAPKPAVPAPAAPGAPVPNLAPAFPPASPFGPTAAAPPAPKGPPMGAPPGPPMGPPPGQPPMQQPPLMQQPPPMAARDPFASPQRDPFAAAPPPQPGAKPATPSMPVPAPAAQGNMQLIPADLGAHSSTNFYKGLSGNDIIDHGGLFISTYVSPKIGTPVRLKVSLPGGYEFEANAVVKWTRDSGGDGEPGFGARFTAITPEARQLVYRYVRNREPLFYDDF